LKKGSERFAIKKYRDSIFKGEILVEGKKRKRHGLGVCQYGNGRIYEGEWAEDQRNGRGHERFSNGNTYIGEYRQNKAEGKGVYTW